MDRATHKIDATNQIAGRLASQIAVLLMGKNKPSYEPNVDSGDFVEVENVAGMIWSGKKLEKKVYHRTTGYPGGIRTTKLSELMETNPSEALRKAIRLMLPKNKLRNNMLKRLKIT